VALRTDAALGVAQPEAHAKTNRDCAAMKTSRLPLPAAPDGAQLPAALHAASRSDAEIARSVQNVLAWLVALPLDAVRAVVERGHVTLAGHVEWQHQRDAALAAVGPMRGVHSVTDRIVIQGLTPSLAIKAGIEAALQRRAWADTGQVVVQVHGGDVTLTGVVHSAYERQRAAQAAWAAPGVRNVVDRLVLVG
jgi:osmotically-inducible protein OsmY